jgi:CheY-like chemotaxis protein
MLNIMLIDDQALLAKWLREDLSDEKYQISHTTNTGDIHDDIATFKPDIILLDICFDGFERWDILHWIKLKSFFGIKEMISVSSITKPGISNSGIIDIPVKGDRTWHPWLTPANTSRVKRN